MKEQRLEDLFTLYINKSISGQEEQELMNLLTDPDLQAARDSLIEGLYDKAAVSYLMDETHATRIFDEIICKARPARIKLWPKMGIAASVLFLFCSGLFFLHLNNKSKHALDDKGVLTAVKGVNAPTANRASILLGNGQVVHLENEGEGTLARQGSVQLQKMADGKIVYNGAATSTTIDTYNTLINPRGSKVIDMTLNDGSHVWLNAGSSVTYPVAFTGKERKITLSGEAYFEVAHNAAMPFIVSKGDMEIVVLGTAFNVNAYDDEGDSKVTLLQGSVKMSVRNGPSSMLKPGEQAIVTGDKNLAIENTVDLETVMAWKNGKFQFGEATRITDILKQVARWYDVDVVYKDNITAHIGGGISRDVNISQILEMLQMTGGVKFEVEGRKVLVSKK